MGLSLVIGGRGSEKVGGGGREAGLVKFSLVYFFCLYSLLRRLCNWE